MTVCICRRHAVRMDCPVHGDLSYRQDFVRLTQGPPSVMNDPAWQEADKASWDERKALEEGSA